MTNKEPNNKIEETIEKLSGFFPDIFDKLENVRGVQKINYVDYTAIREFLSQALTQSRQQAIEECIEQVRCRCESHESHEEDATCKRRTEEIREELNKLKS